MDKITTAEAARRHGLSQQHIRRLAQAGVLPAEQVTPRLYLVDAAAVAAYAAGEHKPGWPKGRPRNVPASDAAGA